MTSKEALDYMYIISICNSGNDETTDKVCEGYNKIADDLEILDQLSNILSADYLFRVFNYETAKEIRDYLKSNELIKEWLENEK